MDTNRSSLAVFQTSLFLLKTEFESSALEGCRMDDYIATEINKFKT